MRKILIVLVCFSSFQVYAKTKRIDFERDPANSKSNLSDAFQQAIKGSDVDLNFTQTTLKLEEQSRKAKWSGGETKKITIQGTAAIDSQAVRVKYKKTAVNKDVDAEKELQKELNDIE